MTRKHQLCARILSGFLSVVLLMPSVFAADKSEGSNLKFSLSLLENSEYWYIAEVWGEQIKEKRNFDALDPIMSKENFDDAYSCYTDPTQLKDTSDIGEYKCIDDESKDFFSKDNIDAFSMAIMITNAPKTTDTDTTVTASQKITVDGRNLRIGTGNYRQAVTLKVPGIEVKNGSLSFQNRYTGKTGTGSYQDYANQRIVVELSEPITLGENGKLYMDERDYSPITLTGNSALIAPTGKNAIVINGNGAEAHLGYFTVKRPESDQTETALIDVQSGALYLEAKAAAHNAENGMPDFDRAPTGAYPNDTNVHLNNGSSSAPAIEVSSGAEVVVKGGQLSAEGSAPVIAVEEGGAITISGDETINIESKGEGTPAITVAEGATLAFESEGTPEITAKNNQNVAIEIAGGATVQRAERTIHVADAVIDEEPQAVVDNAGNIIVKPGATVDESDAPMNAAVILGDGAIVEGSATEAPTIQNDENGKVIVTVPVGGKVTDADNKVTNMPNGGSVIFTEDSGTEVVEVPATGISLNESSVTLYSNTTPNTVLLTATVEPNNTTDTVAWSSDNTSVATVDENGVVTAAANGTATITAKAGNAESSCTVTVRTYSSGGGSSSGSDDSDPTYSISTPDSVTGGSIKVTPNRASAGTRVTITAKPSSGYELDELTVTDSKGKELKVTDRGDNKYTFQMPSSKVTVEATFVEIGTEPETPVFTDVSTSAYYYDAVEWAVSKGITSGTSATTFSPDTSCTRAQMVTFLWRAAGSPAPKSTVNPFTDVQAGSYYYDAVLWAVEQGITSGTSATTFAPDATVTRAQTVTFLYRAAGSPAVTGGSFADVAADAYYAVAVAWAVSENITAGTGNGLFSPDTACSRAQIVTFLYRDAL